MCYRRARAGRAKQTGFRGRRTITAIGAALATAAGTAPLAGCSAVGSQGPKMWVVAARQLQRTPPGVDPQELSAALLAPSDMGSGFSLLPMPAGGAAASGATATSVTGCPQLGILGRVGMTVAQNDQGVTYQSADLMPLLAESLRTAPGTDPAAEYAEDRAALATCTSLDITVGGTGFTLKLTPASLGRVKSATAVRLDGLLDGVQVGGYLAVDDVGAAELGYLLLQVDTGSPQLAAYLFQRADGKARHYLDAVWSS